MAGQTPTISWLTGAFLAMAPLWASGQGFREISGQHRDLPGQTMELQGNEGAPRNAATDLISDLGVSDCVSEAAAYYRVEERLVQAIMVVEGGRPGMKNANTNGTHDYGVMQINTIWLDHPDLEGISESVLRRDACANIFVGAWILAREIYAADGDLWKGVGNYHSRTPKHHNRYRKRVQSAYQRLAGEVASSEAIARTRSEQKTSALDNRGDENG